MSEPAFEYVDLGDLQSCDPATGVCAVRPPSAVEPDQPGRPT